MVLSNIVIYEVNVSYCVVKLPEIGVTIVASGANGLRFDWSYDYSTCLFAFGALVWRMLTRDESSCCHGKKRVAESPGHTVLGWRTVLTDIQVWIMFPVKVIISDALVDCLYTREREMCHALTLEALIWASISVHELRGGLVIKGFRGCFAKRITTINLKSCVSSITGFSLGLCFDAYNCVAAAGALSVL
ncbi:hypothetical protein M8C21_020447 [Ambrosia artemisiifolia]|uniref:Uncharacterized protein n=1 Tax=Ambrosia artemisiifolia TaxID=4212 RepID=A0AAD5CAS4_AMBAR|nr:hypothetical protein M8C21_020447 [Ambrosia artemisiifolia]